MDFKVSTKEFLQEAYICDSISSFVKNNNDKFINLNFSEYLSNLISTRKIKSTQLINRSNIEKGYFYQLLNGRRKPSRDKIIQLAIGMKLDINETELLLLVGQRSILYPRIPRDLIIMKCLSEHKSLSEIQILLYDMGYELLS